jgi:pimeloyl-ACP methyl ester carboxylesterase
MGKITKEEIFIDSAGQRIHLDIFNNTGEKKTIVFFPGTGAASEFYATFLEAVAYKGFNIIGIDPLGHGHSSGKRGDFTMEQLLTNLKDTVVYSKKKFSGKTGIMGSSQGGIVVYYAALEGIEVDAVVAHNAALVYKEFLNIVKNPGLNKRMLPVIDYLKKHFPSIKIPTMSYLNWKKVFNNPKMLKMFKDDKLFTGSYTARAIASLKDYVPDIKGLPMPPTMIITGTKDEIIPKEVSERAFYALRGNLHTYIEIEGAAHMLPLEYMSQILPRIEDWFATRLG